MTEKPLLALMTLAPTKLRGEIPRGSSFAPSSAQEARDLITTRRAESFATHDVPQPDLSSNSDAASPAPRLAKPRRTS